MKLNLKKPIVFFDLETTGLNISEARIVELSFLKVHPNGEEEVKSRRVNPGIPIPPESTAIHGITDEDVKDCPTFKQIAKSLASHLEGCDLAGFNSNRFDVPMLAEEFLRAGVDFDMSKPNLIDVQVIYHKKEPRTLEAAYKFYCDKELTDSHSAEVDARATYEVFKSQLAYYSDLENDIEVLAEEYGGFKNNVDLAGRIVLNDEGIEVFNFGKHRGKPVAEILEKEPSYYSWMMDGDFPLNTKQVLTKIRIREAEK